MEEILNKHFDQYLTQMILDDVNELYKLEHNSNLFYVHYELLEKYRNLKNEFYCMREREYTFDDSVLSFTFMKELSDDPLNMYIRYWKFINFAGFVEDTDIDWRDNIFFDRLRKKTHKRTIKRIYGEFTKWK
jgi:hypothetical protein